MKEANITDGMAAGDATTATDGIIHRDGEEHQARGTRQK
jgi:hypothetical protein